jgi:hypothetical protein
MPAIEARDLVRTYKTSTGVLRRRAIEVEAVRGVSFEVPEGELFGLLGLAIPVNSDTQITATVPSGATSGAISVTTPGGTVSSSSSFTVTVASSAPTISSFNPASARVGTSVTIIGTGFTGATQVAFNGTPSSYIVNSDAQITATVPSGATTGPISLTTPGGTTTSSKSLKIR